MSRRMSPTDPAPDPTPRSRLEDVTVSRPGPHSRVGDSPRACDPPDEPAVTDRPSPDPPAPERVTRRDVGGLHDLTDAHQRTIAALKDPESSSLVAVAWAAGHLAAAARVLYPVAVRTLPEGRDRVHTQLAADHRLQQDLWRLDRLLSGDVRLAGTSVGEVEDAVCQGLQEHATGAHRLIVDLRAALDPQEQHELDDKLAAALRDGPTRPHPHTPHDHLAGRRTFWFWGAVDRMRDLMDSRIVPTLRVAVPRPLGRWGAYLMGISPSPRRRPRP